MNVMNVKRKFTMDEVISLAENCYSVGSANWLRAQLEDYVTADDVIDLCDLREIGFENVRLMIFPFLRLRFVKLRFIQKIIKFKK